MREKHLLSYFLPRTYRVLTQGRCRSGGVYQHSPEPLARVKRLSLTALQAGSAWARGLGLMWWEPSQARTLLLNTATKQYFLGFDRRLFVWKSTVSLHAKQQECSGVPSTRVLNKGWLGAPFVRELGTWGSVSSFKLFCWLQGFIATKWSYTRSGNDLPLGRACMRWEVYRPVDALLWGWDQCIGAMGSDNQRALDTGGNSLGSPMLALDWEQSGPWSSTLWAETYNVSSLTIHAFETWDLESMRSTHEDLPQTWVLYDTLVTSANLVTKHLPLWGLGVDGAALAHRLKMPYQTGRSFRLWTWVKWLSESTSSHRALRLLLLYRS